MQRKVRVALFISSDDGHAILHRFLTSPLKEVAHVVGVATDDPRTGFVGAHRRFWRYGYSKEERLLVRNRAEKAGIPVWDGRIKDKMAANGTARERTPFPAIFRELWQPDVAYMSSFGQLIPQSLIDVPSYGFFNVHPTSLEDLSQWPRFGGPSPYEDMRAEGIEFVTLALHRITARFDEGRIECMSSRVPLHPGTARKSPENRRMLAVLTQFTGWIAAYHFETEILPRHRTRKDSAQLALPTAPYNPQIRGTNHTTITTTRSVRGKPRRA